MTARTILLVDDDPDLRETLVEQLALYEEFSHPAGGHRHQGHRRQRPTRSIFDHGCWPSDMDGREAVKLLRKSGFNSPVILLTGHDTDADTILGLEAEGHDYVTKPFRFAVLLARIRAQLRQYEQSEDATFSVGGYLFKPAAEASDRWRRQEDKADGERSGNYPLSVPGRAEGRHPRRVAGGSLGLYLGVTKRIRSRPMSIACGRRSKKILPMPKSWSPKCGYKIIP